MIEIVKTLGRFRQLRDGWDELAESHQSPLMSHDWYFSCARAFYTSEDLRIVVLQSGGETVAAAPLAARKRGGIEYLELLGSPFLSEPNGLLYKNLGSLRELFSEIYAFRRPLILQRMFFSPAMVEFLKNAVGRRAIAIQRHATDSLYVPTRGSWGRFCGRLKSRRRSDLHRARRRAEKHGNIRAKIFCPDHSELQNWLDAAFAIEASGWKGRRGSAIIHRPDLRLFFETLCKRACTKGVLRLCFLYVDSAAVAMQIGLQSHNRLWILKIGYDEKWKRCSPGIQLTHEAIRHTFDQHLEAYEFLGSDEAWLYAWPVERHSYRSVGLYPLAPRGLFGVGKDFSVFFWRRLLQMHRGLF